MDTFGDLDSDDEDKLEDNEGESWSNSKKEEKKIGWTEVGVITLNYIYTPAGLHS